MGFTFAMLLAPTTLSTTASNGWKNPSFIAMQTVGGLLFIVWCVWEWRFAQYPIMPKVSPSRDTSRMPQQTTVDD